jgi:glycosyltransferase involved in cell wall biosynthesis
MNEDRVHIMHIVGDPVGGIRKHVHCIINGLDERKFIQSYAYSSRARDSEFLKNIENISKILHSTIELRIKKRPSPHDVANLIHLGRYIKKEKVDIVHGHGAKGGLYARILANYLGIRSIYTPHGGVVHTMFNPVEDWLYSTVEKWLYGKTDYFLFESRYTADAFHLKIKRKSKPWLVNYNGLNDIHHIDFIESKVGRESEDFKIGVFGMLRSQKGQIYAINAVRNMIHQGINISLHLFGDGPDRKYLEMEVKKLGIESFVIFHGDVSSVLSYMNEMDIVLIPSLFESFGYVALEAMSLKKPVIASNTGGLTELIVNGETGLLVPVAEVESIKSAIVRYMENRGFAAHCGTKGYERLKTFFTEARMVETISEVYLKVANKK